MNRTEAKEIKPEELIQTLLEGAPSKEFDFVKFQPDGSKTTTKIRMRYLRAEESLKALKAAQDVAKELGELQGYGDIYREAQAYEILRPALCHPEKRTRDDGTSYYPALFTDTRQIRASFNEGEISVLLNCYNITKSLFSSLEGLDEAETWIARLSDPLKGPFYLSQLDSHHYPACILMLAKIAADLYRSAGLPLPSLDDTSASDQPSSTPPTGSSGEQPSASSTEPDLELGPDKILTADEARELVAKRRKPE
jgi:hypothetical protein